MRPLEFTLQIMKRLHYRFWLAQKGYGKPQPRKAWNEQYKMGEWEYLDSLKELDHYSVIVGYIRQLFERPEILDVGCGHGRLLQLLHPSWFQCYTGVDFSQEAISRASRLNMPSARFVTQDFEQWTPSDLFDVIVFNESLYYGRHPTELIKSYLPALRSGGKVIVSMHEAGNHRIIWSKLDSALRPMHGVHLHADHGQEWTVRIFERTPECYSTT